jgi:hypothetical protein
MEINGAYLQQSKDKIKSIIARYYTPLHYEVQVKFGSEPAVTILPLKKD